MKERLVEIAAELLTLANRCPDDGFPVKDDGRMGKCREIAAQCWCYPETSHLAMIPELAEAFAKRLYGSVVSAFDAGWNGKTATYTMPEEEMEPAKVYPWLSQKAVDGVEDDGA